MNLKTDPKQAIQAFESLVKQGDRLLTFIEDHKKLSSLYERREAEKRLEGDKQYRVNMSGKPVEVQPMTRDIREYTRGCQEWEEAVKATLNAIYEDFIPKYKFKKIEGDFSLLNDQQTREYRTFLILTSKLENQLNFLVAQYDNLISQLRSPLFFLKESSRIVYYDRIVQITPSTDEESLCLCLFDKPIGQTVSYDEIYLRMTGEDEDQRKKSWRNKVKNAYEAVNGKTRKSFGFPIFESKGSNLLFIKILS